MTGELARPMGRLEFWFERLEFWFGTSVANALCRPSIQYSHVCTCGTSYTPKLIRAYNM